MLRLQKIRPCLWFDAQAEEAVGFYLSIFPNSLITHMTRYTEAGYNVHRMEPGTVMTIEFELDGTAFVALNGGPQFKFTEAISLHIDCETQGEVDYYWDKLSTGGDPTAQQCGWLKDQYGVSWQVVPPGLRKLLDDTDPAKSEAVMTALLEMKKLDILALKRAADQAA